MTTIAQWITPRFSASLDYGWQTIGLGLTVYRYDEDLPAICIQVGPLELWLNFGAASNDYD